MNINRINLNLLIGFDALVSESHVTRAGQRLGLTQSAMSVILQQLRELFNDEILVRVSGSMQPTAKALALVEPIKDILQRVDQVINQQQTIQPETLDKTFNLGMSDYSESLLLPRLLAHLQAVAPKVKLKVKQLNFLEQSAPLDSGEIDIYIGSIDLEAGASHIMSQCLFDERGVCIACKTHPAFQQQALTLDSYLAYPHLSVSYRSDYKRNIIEDTLAKKGKQRQVILTVPHAMVAVNMLANSNMICIIGKKLAQAVCANGQLAYQDTPIKSPVFTIYQCWHRRNHKHEPHTWLCQQIKKVAGELE